MHPNADPALVAELVDRWTRQHAAASQAAPTLIPEVAQFRAPETDQSRSGYATLVRAISYLHVFASSLITSTLETTAAEKDNTVFEAETERVTRSLLEALEILPVEVVTDLGYALTVLGISVKHLTETVKSVSMHRPDVLKMALDALAESARKRQSSDDLEIVAQALAATPE